MPVRLRILDPARTRLAPTLRRLLALLHITQGNWSITLVRDEAMADLHWQSLRIPTTTDVLTFDLRDDDGPENAANRPRSKGKTRKAVDDEGTPIDLDTVICLDEARRRARELNHPLRHELILYCLHSLLHVQGYDDLAPQDYQRMHAREDQLLAKIGIGPVYARPIAKASASLKNHKSKIKNQKPRRAS